MECIFNRFDKNQDGFLNLQEAIPFFEKYLKLPRDAVQIMFEDIDKNEDDKISKEELCDFFRETVVHENSKCHEHEFQKRAKDFL